MEWICDGHASVHGRMYGGLHGCLPCFARRTWKGGGGGNGENPRRLPTFGGVVEGGGDGSGGLGVVRSSNPSPQALVVHVNMFLTPAHLESQQALFRRSKREQILMLCWRQKSSA